MTTSEEQRWRKYHEHLWRDQNPGCHTGASGFGYVAWTGDADKAIDAEWEREEREARAKLVRVLRRRLS